MFPSIEKTILIVVLIVAVIIGICVLLKYILPVLGKSKTKVVGIIMNSKNPIMHLRGLVFSLGLTSVLYFLYHVLGLKPESLPILILASIVSIILIFIPSLLIREQTYNFSKKLQLIDLSREMQVLIFELKNDRTENPKQSIRSILIKYNFDELCLGKIYKKLVDIYSTQYITNGDICNILINTLNHNILDNHPDLRMHDFNPKP